MIHWRVTADHCRKPERTRPTADFSSSPSEPLDLLESLETFCPRLRPSAAASGGHRSASRLVSGTPELPLQHQKNSEMSKEHTLSLNAVVGGQSPSGSDEILEIIRRHGQPLKLELTLPRGGHVSARQAFATYLGLEGATLVDLGSLPQGGEGQRLMALRYIIANGETWLRHFSWQEPLTQSVKVHVTALGGIESDVRPQADEAISRITELVAQIAKLRTELIGVPPAEDQFLERLFAKDSALLGPDSAAKLTALVQLHLFPELRQAARTRLRTECRALYSEDPRSLDLLYLSTVELTSFPATTVSAGTLKYVIIADKGEMGVRAVREAIALEKVPVTLYSKQDDARSLQVRLTRAANGITIGLEGNFRQSYANYIQITERIIEEFKARFGKSWADELSHAALYPGYGPLAENAAAISHFRRHGVVFIGPMQDVVENIGDKRNFRLLAQALDPEAVTPGIVIDSNDPQQILQLVKDAHQRAQFQFPGRLKAANGGGGRGQAIVGSLEELEPAIQKVLGEIESFAWDPGVMFEQNISETIHLEVQVLRDRYGNTRHFGMRDCSEQRASQKIQEEAPPAILVRNPELQRRIEAAAVQIADRAGYVGAATIELMFKGGRFYFLEANTRIQVEHPVTEECHSIVRPDSPPEALNLVRLQMQLADGIAIDFEQDQIITTHVAREFRINAEAWNPKLKDSRDGQVGLFLPNAGIFDEISIPRSKDLRGVLKQLPEIEEVKIRFDSGFEKGDILVNKDPTFGKLLVSVRAPKAQHPYELLRRVCLEVLEKTKIRGRQVKPDGTVISKSEFKNNLSDHKTVLKAKVLRDHSIGEFSGRHVNWVIKTFRETSE